MTTKSSSYSSWNRKQLENGHKIARHRRRCVTYVEERELVRFTLQWLWSCNFGAPVCSGTTVENKLDSCGGVASFNFCTLQSKKKKHNQVWRLSLMHFYWSNLELKVSRARVVPKRVFLDHTFNSLLVKGCVTTEMYYQEEKALLHHPEASRGTFL